MDKIKTIEGKVLSIDGKAICVCCFGDCIPNTTISGEVDRRVGPGDNTQPCRDFDQAVTSPAFMAGFYRCTGGVDDSGFLTWPGGSFDSPAEIPPCFGAHTFSFYAKLNVGETVTCYAGSYGGRVGCSISCCLVKAP